MSDEAPLIDRLLVPLDGSEVASRGLRTATRLAARADLVVEGLAVVAPGEEAAGEEALVSSEELAGASLDVRSVAVAEDAAGAIVERAARDGVVVCMATRGRGSVRAAAFGSVAEAVVRGLGREVVLTGPSARDAVADPRALHVCVDGSEMSASVLPAAICWARLLDLVIDVVHVAAPFPDPERPAAGVRPDEEEALAVVRAATARCRAAGIEAGWTLAEDPDPASRICSVAADDPGGLLALATHGRSGVARVLAGSVAYAVVRDSPVPVLARRPAELFAS